MPVVWSAIGASVLPNVGGWLGSLLVQKNYETWYKGLKKPAWTPPKYAFGPIWTGLYSSMGYASYLVWRDGGGFDGAAKVPLSLFAAQLALNWAWTPIFFGYHSPKWALYDIILLSVSATGCAVAFNSVNQTAGFLMLPYIAWLGLATSLNYYIYKHNAIQDSNK